MFWNLLNVVLAGALVVLSALWWANKRPKNYPPGPLKLPIVGNLHNLRNMGNGGLSAVFTEYAKTYGPVFSFDFGPHRSVVLNGHKLIKEAWNNPVVCGRPRIYGIEDRSGGQRRGILFHDGDHWQEQRRFALRHLKEFGFGKRSMESLVLDEIAELLQGLHKDAGTPISTQLRFNAAVLNALWTITTGNRFNHDDPTLRDLLIILQQLLGTTGGAKPLLFISWLVKLAPRLTGFTELQKNFPTLYDFLWKQCRPILSEYDGDSPQFFAHVYIDEMRKTTDPKSSFYGEEGEKSLVTVLRDLFEAGAETTSTTLSWLFLYMAVFPDHQKPVQDEIDRVLNSKKPSIQDRYQMPYTEAVILETLRYSSMIPLGAFHRAVEDVHIGGYFIPKNTNVIANLGKVHSDPALWTHPHEFQPERFLTPDRTSVIKTPEGFFPFSTGKRVCIGETLARDELFLFTTSILQEFDVDWDRSRPKPSLRKNLLMIVTPEPHYIVLTARSKPH